ncbi:MAG: DUF362 domain-containing protein [Candidatus Bathyarchaeota archaeon]|nr:DUF362 domain-containing protein [Candidatus Bathyarchaeota archaeon]
MRQHKHGNDLLSRLTNNMFLLGIVSIVWFVLRTGRKPSRAAYPCQQAAALNSNLWFMTYVMPVVSAIPVRASILSDRKQTVILVSTVIVLAAAGGWWYFGGSSVQPLDFSLTDNGLTLEAQTADFTTASDIFVVTGTSGNDGGVDTLVELMGGQDLLLYRSDRTGRNRGPEGLIDGDDVVLLKVNCQWDERGGTNTDLLKALIQALVDHPDGFTGEIIVSDNGQGENRGSGSRGGAFDYINNNALDTSQSIQNVVDEFAEDHQVSTYLWSDITEIQVDEYDEGDMDDGYVINETRNPRTEIMVSYAKFITEYGTHVSFKKGIWAPAAGTYDSDRLKIINVSMLKSHSVYGVTASVKNYMGVPSDVTTSRISGRSLDTHNTIGRGGMGTLMVETRYPVLNIIDSIWINPVPLNGPYTSYRSATSIGVIAAATDPVALDYWCSKNILLQNWEVRTGDVSDSMNPDNTTPGFFGSWLRLSMQEIILGGYHANIDEAYMNVYITDNQTNQ